MPHRFTLCLVVLMLLLQGVATHVRAEALPGSSQMHHHCDGHETSAKDCPCCDDETMLTGGCATLCSMMTALPVTSFYFPCASTSEPHRLVVLETPGPDYVPLNPPPIS
jgi:hypothetical protein